MMIITEEMTRTKLAELIRANPNKIAAPRYQIDGVPECIVGCLLAEFGVSNDTLAQMDSAGVAGCVVTSDSVLEILAENDVTLNDDALSLMDRAQTLQDSENRWEVIGDTLTI
jgi:hypothetical protein